MTILIAITGGSGSGKSTLAEALISSLPEGVATLLREDSYYLDAASVPGFDATTHDFDDVAARDHDLLISDLTDLKAGRSVTDPSTPSSIMDANRAANRCRPPRSSSSKARTCCARRP